jgi:hypothetical protein
VPTIGLLGDHRPDQIPASHRDLVQARRWPPDHGHAGWLSADLVVWCDFDGVCVRVNTMRGFAKARNMRANPQVTRLCYDPTSPTATRRSAARSWS